MLGRPETATWFTERAKAIQGVDLTAPMSGAPSELVIDTDRVTVWFRQRSSAPTA